MKPRYTITQDEFTDSFEAVNFKQAVGIAENMLTDHPQAVTITDLYAHKNKPKQYTVTNCTGEAHANPFIDHCWVCMPRWGIVVKPLAIPKERRDE